jgi:hypothetical protein
MKYTVTHVQVMAEQVIDENTYKVDLHLEVQPDSELIPAFTKVLTVESTNAMTGYEVDEQRTNAINSYISEINK